MINWIISSSVLIIVVICLRTLFKGKIRLRFQYALWLLVVVRLLIPLSFGSSAISVQNVTNHVVSQSSSQGIAKTDFVSPDILKAPVTENKIKIYDSVLPENTQSNKEDSDTSKSFQVSERFLKIAEILWIIGAVVLGITFVITNAHFHRKIKRSRQRLDVSYINLPVYVSNAIDSPCLFGLFRPCIYVTQSVAENSMLLRHCVYHELTHFKQGDLIWGILRCICLSLHWYNPLVWWAARLSRQDAELACDEATIAKLGEDERLEYGKTLIELTCRKRDDLFVTATTMSSKKKNVGERITLIARKPKMAFYAVLIIVVVSAIAIGCTFTKGKEESLYSFPEKAAEERTLAVETIDSALENEVSGDALSEDGSLVHQPQFYTEPQKDKVCLAVMPDGISKAGGDYRYLIPEDQNSWMDAYEEMRLHASDSDIWLENEKSYGIWVVYNDEWTCMTDQGFIFDFAKRVNIENAARLYSLCHDEALSNGTGSPLRPENIPQISSATLEYQGTYTVTDRSTLNDLRKILFTSKELRGGAACPFTAALTLKFEEKDVETIYWATDDCSVWLTDGVYYEYFGYTDIEEIYNIFKEKAVEAISYLSDPLPGIPCENPVDHGWNLENTKDIRGNFSYMSYVPEEGTEGDTYLIGQTDIFTLYGMGDYGTMLLECEGKYAEIGYPYTSNYMTPLELMEINLDRDGKEELAIKFNIKHGTGISIDTFLLADFGADEQLYVHQFLDEDFTAQLAAHLSFEKKPDGIQPMVDGQSAGFFEKNRDDVDPFLTATVGSQMHFYYDQLKGEIQLSGDIMLLWDDIGGTYGCNSNDVTGTVHWDGEHFYLDNFTSKNRSLEEQVTYALQELYHVPNLYYVNVRYDSSEMNQDTIVITAEILPKETDSSFDYAEIHLKRDTEPYSVSGWNIEDIEIHKK